MIGTVKDLGLAAFLKMIGFRLVNKRGRDLDFEYEDSQEDIFRSKQIEYINSIYASFDNEVMNLKKMPMNGVDKESIGLIKDYGVAAFLKMNGYSLAGRDYKEFQFDVHLTEKENFEKSQVEYLNSGLSKFNNEVINLKKLSVKSL